MDNLKKAMSNAIAPFKCKTNVKYQLQKNKKTKKKQKNKKKNTVGQS